MKEILTRNLGLKILSLSIAFLLWLIVINLEDPAIVGNFEGIPVTVINEEAIDSIDKVYNIVSGEEIDIKVKGKRSIIENLSRTDFIATADLEELSIVNAMEIKVSVPKYANQVEIIDQSVTTMKISLENLVTEQFRVDIVERGTIKEGYYISEKTASPNLVQIKGAQSVISKIKEVVVGVDVTGADETFTITASPQVYDHNGTLMNPEKMELSHNEFNITVNLLETKTVKLFLELEGTPAYGYDYVSFEYEPKEVEIAGTRQELDKVPLITGSYSINGAREDIEDEVNINDFIDKDVILIDSNQNAVINVDIEPLENKEIMFPTSSIKIKNLPMGVAVEFMESGPLAVKATGLNSAISAINTSNINPYIDLADFEGSSGDATVLFDPSIDGVELFKVTVPIRLVDVE
ncbi:MAG: hypothetical protein GX323_05880 [Clostridiales bacterium]|nr:hypothetical protein [Clostridiales bacterium]